MYKLKIRGEQISLVGLAAQLRFLDFSYLQKWTIFWITMGVAADASTVAFSLSATFLTSLFFGAGVRYSPPSLGAGVFGPSMVIGGLLGACQG